MSWTALVAQMLDDLNPKLKVELEEGGIEALEDWVRMSARWMAETYHNLSANGRPMRQTVARETVIAQMREEILHAYEPMGRRGRGRSDTRGMAYEILESFYAGIT